MAAERFYNVPQPTDAMVSEVKDPVMSRIIGTYGGHQWESVEHFINNVDTQQRKSGLGSWEMGALVIKLLTDEAAIEHQKWAALPAAFPNSDHWSEQVAQHHRNRVPYQAGQEERAVQGEVGQPGYRAAQVYREAQPELPPLAELPEVLETQCLKHYLQAAFTQTKSVAAAANHFEKFKSQPTNMTMRSYFNRLQIAMVSYHAVKYTGDERRAVTYAAEKEKDLFEVADLGMIKLFKKYVELMKASDRNSNITFAALETTALYWESATEEGRSHVAKCKAFTTVSALNAKEEEDEAKQQDYSSTSAAAASKDKKATNKGKGKGKGKNTSNTDPTQKREGAIKPITSNHPDYWKPSEIPTHLKSSYPRCFYWGICSHPRQLCPHLKRDLDNNINLPYSKQRGKIKSQSQLRREASGGSASSAQQPPSAPMLSHGQFQPQQLYPNNMVYYPVPGQQLSVPHMQRQLQMPPPPVPLPPGTQGMQQSSQAFYQPGAAPPLPPDNNDGRVFTSTGNYGPNSQWLTRWPYMLSPQSVRQLDGSANPFGPTQVPLPLPQQQQQQPQSQQPRESQMGSQGPFVP